MSLEDYEILNILSNESQTKTFKVRNKLSNDFYMLHVFNFENNINLSNEIITKKIKHRQLNVHPNLLYLHKVLNDETNKTLSILTDYCYYGNLCNLIENCLKESKYFEEPSVYKIIFQLLCAIKTIENHSLSHLNMNEIYLDSDFNIKLLDFNILYNKDQKNVIKISELGKIIYHLSTLKPYNKKQEEVELKKIQLYYSSQFLLFLKEILKDSTNLNKKLDKIVSNPIILLKYSQWRKDKIFFTVNTNNNNYIGEQINSSEAYLLKLQNLRAREIAVQAKEQKLKEKEYSLHKREKELTLMQRVLKEKLSRAELYLKACRESKSSSNKNLQTKIYTADSSFSADCSDLNLVTSKKLNTDIIYNKSGFARSYSERRVKFKGHSPLKDIEYNKRKSLKVKKKKLPLKEIPENIYADKPNSQECLTNVEKIQRTNKKLFDELKTDKENKFIRENEQKNIRPISWTNENKKYAFDLLKIMNDSTNGYNSQNDVKHTYL